MSDARGPLYMIVATLGFAVLGLFVKLLPGLPSGQVVFWRSFLGAVLLVPVFWRTRAVLRGVNHRALVARAAFGTASMWAYFIAIDRLDLGDAVLVAFASPMVVTLLAPWVTGERAPKGLWTALFVGFAGIALVVEPSGSVQDPIGVVAALATTWLAASAYLAVRVASRTDPRETIVFWFSVLGAVFTLPSFWGGVVWPTPAEAGLLAGVAVAGLVAQLAMTMAYSVAPAPEVALFAYATPVWAYVLGVVVLHEAVDWRGVVGTALVVVSGVLARRRPKGTAAD